MKYSVIIPTMWMALPLFKKMLIEYVGCYEVGEVIIIKNADLDDLEFLGFLQALQKIKIVDAGKNLYVNPSWEIGVQIAQYDQIILANDDIFVYDIDTILNTIHIPSKGIIGFDKSCFHPCLINKRNEEIKCNPCTHYTLTWGFGVFMILRKQDYIPIPKELKVWYGDMFLFRQLNPYLITGVNIATPMQSTTSKLDLKEIKQKEKRYFKQNKSLFVHKR